MVIKDLAEVDQHFQKNADIPRREPPGLHEVDGEGRPLTGKPANGNGAIFESARQLGLI